jgi:hypothetical protein
VQIEVSQLEKVAALKRARLAVAEGKTTGPIRKK